MESIWATIKKEIRHIWGPWEQLTRSQIRTILFEYIEVFYNRHATKPGSTTAPPPRPTLPLQPLDHRNPCPGTWVNSTASSSSRATTRRARSSEREPSR